MSSPDRLDGFSSLSDLSPVSVHTTGQDDARFFVFRQLHCKWHFNPPCAAFSPILTTFLVMAGIISPFDRLVKQFDEWRYKTTIRQHSANGSCHLKGRQALGAIAKPRHLCSGDASIRCVGQPRQAVPSPRDGRSLHEAVEWRML